MLWEAISAYSTSFKNVFYAIYGVLPDTETGFYIAMANLIVGDILLVIGFSILAKLRSTDTEKAV